MFKKAAVTLFSVIFAVSAGMFWKNKMQERAKRNRWKALLSFAWLMPKLMNKKECNSSKGLMKLLKAKPRMAGA